jgi:hypothetical protein
LRREDEEFASILEIARKDARIPKTFLTQNEEVTSEKSQENQNNDESDSIPLENESE